MDGTQVGIFKKRDKISLYRFLESSDCRRLESKVGLKILRNFTNQALERKLADQELGGFLIATNFAKSDGSYDGC